MKKLELEFRNNFNTPINNFKSGEGITILMTPDLNEDYWLFRIKLHREQSLVAFPKFNTIGIGFAVEKDWNTNLPYQCETREIYDHIKHNKKYKVITDTMCLEAIEILRKASKYYKENEMSDEIKTGNIDAMKVHLDKLMAIISTP
jgi:hypothetical protein